MSIEKEDILTRKYRHMGMSWKEAMTKVDMIKAKEEVER